MSVKVPMQAPTVWPFTTPAVPANLMPSGNSYRTDSNNQIQAMQADVGTLFGYGFVLPTVNTLPSISDNGTLVTISADGKVTGALDVAEHLHFHEATAPGTPHAGGAIYADSSDHKLKYTFHDGTTTDLAPGGASGDPAVLIESGSAAKVSTMSAASALTGTELAYVVQGGAPRKTTTQDIADLGRGIIQSTGLILVTSAEILAISSAPKLLLVGVANQVKIVTYMIAFRAAPGTGYSNTGGVQINYGTDTDIALVNTDRCLSPALGFAAPNQLGAYEINLGSGDFLNKLAGESLFLSTNSSSPTGGDGDIYIELLYLTITIPS